MGWSSQHDDIFHSPLSSPTLVGFRTVMSVIAIFLLLVIKGIIRWITKYKLRYLFRITCFIFIFNTVVFLVSILFGFSFYFHIISFCFPKWQESSSSFLLQKYIWISSVTWCFVVGVIRYHWAMPINIIKKSSSVGFSHLERIAKSRHRTLRDLSEKMLRHREPGDLNPVYVNGWIPLIESREVIQGRPVSVVAVGYKFCIYRGEDRQVFVLDAYCPHMGADLSAGGNIIGNCIECPFHGWQFDGQTGKCIKIPYSEKVPEVARVKVWSSCEKNGFIFVWHHAENEPPSWELPTVPQIESGEWLYRGRSEFTVHCHIQEIPENGADIAHLPQVHSRFVFFEPEIERVGAAGHWFKHDWQPQWSPDEKDPHIARVKIIQRLMFGKLEVPYSRINVDIQQIGPASVYLYMDSEFGHGILLQYITTEGPMLQRVVQELYTEPKLKPGPASFMIWGEAAMIERDIAVWNNKKYLRNPLLVKEDKLILKFRRWFSQFYSEHSPTLKDLRQRSLDW